MTNCSRTFGTPIPLVGGIILSLGGFFSHEYTLVVAGILILFTLVLFKIAEAICQIGETLTRSTQGIIEALKPLPPSQNTPTAPLQTELSENDELRQQLAADQKLKTLGQLAAGVAHELNTPIQYVNNNVAFIRDELLNVCGLLSEYKELTAQLPECAEGISKINSLYRESDPEYLINEIPSTLSQTIDGLGHITKIVGALREFSHPGSKEPLPTDVNRVINTVSALCRNEWKYVADLILDLDTSLPTAECHQSDISQVILNIIVNSAHAIEEKTKGIGKGTIHIASRWKGEAIEISIKDTGVGIPETHLQKIFDPFFTTKPQGKGTGQGLSICRHLVEEVHGGTLSVSTAIGVGSEFMIRLPRKWRAASFTKVSVESLGGGQA